ncbi:hypothetical protein [Kocuria sp. cx-455]|uniref:hypothetical protein n=1 Tax=Kocuria sp. cx-455 TaxID=2771377 RepID=UPI003D72B934
MRTREQRWAARSARGWPRLRVFAMINGITGLLIGGVILWFTHGVLQFENFPAAGVPWIWRVLALAIAVLLPGVLLSMGGYLVLAGATASNRAALAAGRARDVVRNASQPDEPPVVVHKLTDTTPPGVKIRAHALHGSDATNRYTRTLLGALPVQTPMALAPVGLGLVLLVVATVYYAIGYGAPATVILLGVAYLAWKLWRGFSSYQAFSEADWVPTRADDADTGPLPAVTELRESETTQPIPRQRAAYDDAPPTYRAHDEQVAYETTDELPVIERIRDNYSHPKRVSASQRRLAERAERERLVMERRQRNRRSPDDQPPHTITSVERHPDSDDLGGASEQEQQRQQQRRYEQYLDEHQRMRQDRLRNANTKEPEEAPSLLSYAMTRWKGKRNGSANDR